ncbi:MAG: 30S ribosomal protein S11 [Candidatus Hodgkinia cicadicola]
MNRNSLIKTKIDNAILHVNIVPNNIIICCTDYNGNTIAWSSAGERGFKSAKKSSPFATQLTIESILQKISVIGIKTLEVEINGSINRDIALRTLQTSVVNIISIRDITSKPHNGCRPPKIRRV